MTGKTVLVCGGRNFHDWEAAFQELDEIDSRSPIGVIIQGGAPGADTIARVWADKNGIPFRTFKADWKTHGKAAGPIRNRQMLEEGKPDLVVAMPGGVGTADMVKRAKAAGLLVLEVAA